MRNVVASARLGVEEMWSFGELLEGVEEAPTGAEVVRVSCAAFSIFLRFFLSFLSFLDSYVLGVSARVVSSWSSRLRFFFFSFSSVGGIDSARHR
jgi:hypothetical protein